MTTLLDVTLLKQETSVSYDFLRDTSGFGCNGSLLEVEG